ncbi:MAG TPA: hypothetical protein PK185_13965 [Cyclobacteriaceae bacterium]|nr:hypothetical protein [Cyclobacteriaceae bacterium]
MSSSWLLIEEVISILIAQKVDSSLTFRKAATLDHDGLIISRHVAGEEGWTTRRAVQWQMKNTELLVV